MHRRFLGFLAPFQGRGHVLQHHDGIVHYHADSDGQGAHGNDIERVTRSEQVQQGCQEGDGDGQHHDEGTFQPAQEEEHHQHHHQEGDEDGLLQGVDGTEDVGRVVHDGGDFDIGRKGIFQTGEFLFHLADYLHRVVSGLFLDDDLGTAGAVGVGLLRLLFHIVHNARDVTQIHGAAVKAAQHHVQQFRGRLELLLDAERVGIGTYVDAAGRDVPVLCGNDLRDGGNGQVVGLQLGRVAVYLDFTLGSAGYGHRTHAGYAAQRGSDPLLQELVQRAHALVCRGGQNHDGQFVNAELEQERQRGAVRQLLRNHVQFVTDVVGGFVDIGSILELQREHGNVFTGVGGKILQVRYTVEGVLQQLGEVVFHILRRGAGIGAHHHDGVGLHIREVVYRQAHEGENAQDGECQEDQARSDRMIDRCSVNTHNTFTFTPSRRAACPFTTTFQPSWRPSVISYSVPMWRPVFTGRYFTVPSSCST